jgi:hypothetical protein
MSQAYYRVKNAKTNYTRKERLFVRDNKAAFDLISNAFNIKLCLKENSDPGI